MASQEHYYPSLCDSSPFRLDAPNDGVYALGRDSHPTNHPRHRLRDAHMVIKPEETDLQQLDKGIDRYLGVKEPRSQ